MAPEREYKPTDDGLTTAARAHALANKITWPSHPVPPTTEGRT